MSATIYTDVLIAEDKPLLGNTCGQIFTTHVIYLRFLILMKKNGDYHALSNVFQQVGVTTEIHVDNVRQLKLGQWREIYDNRGGIKTSVTETNSPWNNRENYGLKEAKRMAVILIYKKGAPRYFWDFTMVYVIELIFFTALTNHQLERKDTPCSINR